MSESFDPESISDEVLSAFLDGELSRDASTRVERWLAGSPVARQRLAEFRRVSGWLQELPRAELPSEFAAQIMEQAERRMLLPVATASAPAPSRLRRIRFWTLSAGLPLAAACLFMAIQWQQSERPANGVADVRPALERDGSTQIRRDDRPRGDAALAMSGADNSQRLKNPGTTDGQPGLATGASPTEVKLDLLGDEVDPAQIDAVVAKIRDINEKGLIPVVQVYVVDRQHGFEMVQVVLETQRIARDVPASDPRAKPPIDKTASVEGEATPVDVGRQALFVMVGVDSLKSVLEALRARHAGVGAWKLGEPIDLARLDRPSQQRVEVTLALHSIRTETAPKRSVDGTAGKTSTDLASGEPSTSDADRSSSASSGRSVTGGLAAVDSANARIADQAPSADARQLIVTLADSPNASSMKAVTAPSASVVRPAISPSARNNRGEAARPALVRMIFLIESAAAPAADAPPAKSGSNPGGGAA